MKKASRIFWGLGLITAAVFLVLSQMHLITAEISVWSALIGILCVALLISSIADRSFGGIFFSLGLAWLTFAEMLGLPRASFWSVAGIVILLTSGFNMLFPHKSRKCGNRDRREYGEHDYSKYQKTSEGEEDGFVTCANSFGALAKYVDTADFRGGRFQNSFGELKVYLDQAGTTQETVTVEVSNSFGQTTLYVPREWKVMQDISVFAGSVEEGPCNGESRVTCYLKGSVSFGEIEIVYV